MSNLILPDGRDAKEFYKAKEPAGKAKMHTISPWYGRRGDGFNIGGAIRKRDSWDDYYDMYRQHAFLRAAIDKIAKTATDAGIDFVPRDSRATIKDTDVKILKDFFGKQNNFVAEMRKVYQDLLIYGDAYLYIVPDRKRRPFRLKRLAPQTIHIKAAKNGTVEAYYQRDLSDAQDDLVRFEPQEILHFRINDPNNDLYGLSPLESLKWAVTADLYAQRYNASFFQNSGVTGTIIGIKNADPAEIERNRKWLTENYTGPESAHKPLVIEGESISVEKAVATHHEMGFLEGRRFIILEILAVLDVPPAKIGIMESANRSNSKEQDKTFRTESVSPLQNMVQAVINDDFIKTILGVVDTIMIHAEGDTRDALEAMDYYTKGQAWGIFNSNEVRGKLGMGPVDGGDVNGIMTPTGFVPLDRLNLYFQLPQQNTDKVPTVASDPSTGEPTPKRKKTSATNVSPVITKSVLPPALALQGALLKLNEALESEVALLQVYSYLHDAVSETQDERIALAKETIQKALAVDDPFLRKGYVQRVSEMLGNMFLIKMEHLDDMYKPLVQDEDDDAE